MSFSFSFFASSLWSARQKLKETNAPTTVQALVEIAIAGIREPAPATQAGASTNAASTGKGETNTRHPRFAGVFVEAFGHIDADGQKSWLERFVVQPMYE